MSGTIKRFKLSFTNAAEDIPRLISTYGKCCNGECALVLRPHDRQGILIHHEKGGAVYGWRDQSNDAPQKPVETLPLKDALALIKDYQKRLPTHSPITLRGNWSGHLICEDGVPRVELRRKLASYGTLLITSHPTKGWQYRIIRDEKWFSKSGNKEGVALHLITAIEQGLASGMGLLGEACSMRDSHRRAAFDAPYAEAHPLKPAREGKDPIEKFETKANRTEHVESRGKKTSPEAAVSKTQAPETPSTQKPASKNRTEQKKQSAETSSQQSTTPPAKIASPEKPKTLRRKSVSDDTSNVRPKAASPASSDDIDAAKDKLLMDAFGSAIATALGNMSAG